MQTFDSLIYIRYSIAIPIELVFCLSLGLSERRT